MVGVSDVDPVNLNEAIADSDLAVAIGGASFDNFADIDGVVALDKLVGALSARNREPQAGVRIPEQGCEEPFDFR